jgi:transcriptional regulator with XRE-family HTH domain
MYGNPQKRSSAEVRELRKAGGRWLKELRLAAGLSQSQMAARVGADYYTFISQLEIGRGRVPTERYIDWAQALGIPKREFVKGILKHYDPITYQILFEE